METTNSSYEMVAIDKLKKHPKNARKGNISVIKESIQTNGFYGALVAQKKSGYILVGNHRFEAAVSLGYKELPVIWVEADDEQASRLMLVDNRSTDIAVYDDRALLDLLQSVPSLEGTGFKDDDLSTLLELIGDIPTDYDGGSIPGNNPYVGLPPEENIEPTERPVTLADRFLAPPFSVLDTRQGYWRQRKQQWLDMGIKSEVGRASNLLQMSDTMILADKGVDPFMFKEGAAQPNYSAPSNVSGNTPAFFYKKQEMEKIAGRTLTSAEAVAVYQTGELVNAAGETVSFDVGEGWAGAGTSIFDPVLCEIAYRWYCPQKGIILDPFAGGSVRGVVAGKLGYSYYGVDLRQEQVEANEEQRAELIPDALERVKWRTGDSTAKESWADAPKADMVFSCPPYFDLEQYSEDPTDLSNAGDVNAFFDLLTDSFRNCDALLENDRFIVIVMGEVRENNGRLHDMIGRTAEAARRVGWDYYNDAILLTAVGSLALRAGRIFRGSRKLARCHQYVMVFVKGDWKKAHKACGDLTGMVLDLEGEL